ncbi:MAG: aspartate kinase, partial [Clostridia bacterium]|nr:aspartate kinase [Clostridia bacterium]
MPILVSKFGGSSTANADCFRRVLEIVRASPSRRCVVLSAPGTDAAHGEKVTALLADCWRLRDDNYERDAAIKRVVSRFAEIAKALGVAGFDAIAAREIEEALSVSEARALSRGEYLCAKLFSRFSGIPMADASEVVVFDSAGDLDTERTLARFIGLSRKHDRVIVPGFYGADPSGRVRVFPRNGSDITGALAAAGMGAGLYENWTDVPGLMTADPDIAPRARLVPQVSYRQMRALARAGAQVLHPACLDPVVLAGIPTRLRCTMRPESF